MRDFWEVCEVNCDKLISWAFHASLEQPELGAVLGARSPEYMREQYSAHRLGFRRAAEGDTATLDGALREWAEHDARRGIGVGCRQGVGRAVHRRLVPLLISAYAREPERLFAALNASRVFLDRILGVFAEAHLESARVTL